MSPAVLVASRPSHGRFARLTPADPGTCSAVVATDLHAQSDGLGVRADRVAERHEHAERARISPACLAATRSIDHPVDIK